MARHACFLDIQPQAVIDRMTSTAVLVPGILFGRIDASRAVCFPAPTGLHTGTITSNSIEVVWSDTTPVEQFFEVAHRLVGGNFIVTTVSTNVTSFTEFTTPGSRHEYKVRACDIEGCSAWSNTIPATAGGGTLQVAVVGAAVVNSQPAGISCGRQHNKCRTRSRVRG